MRPVDKYRDAAAAIDAEISEEYAAVGAAVVGAAPEPDN